MIYLIIGGSCAGKSQFVKNSFLKGKPFKEYKDLVTICETDTDFMLGKYNLDIRQTGTDRISRKDIPLFFDQIKRLYRRGKNVVCEGDKISYKPAQQEAYCHCGSDSLVLLGRRDYYRDEHSVEGNA